MSGLDLNRLENNEDEILKAEIGALLFNLGKTHIGFWRYYFPTIYDIYDNNHEILGFKAFSSYKNYYDHKDSLGKTPFEVELEKYHLRDFVFNKQVDLPFLQEKIEWQEFFKGDVSKEEFIQKIFFRGCENINSGIDKGSPRNDQQIKLRLWLSKAFGSFKRLIEEKDFDKRRSCFYQNLYDFLDKKITSKIQIGKILEIL
ncbi:MAG: hypothetical protein N2Z81_04185 [Hydrogenothermaceae bacterium]|nr:hypothetical protein [Hydrogenothermaceae bacterium]